MTGWPASYYVPWVSFPRQKHKETPCGICEGNTQFECNTYSTLHFQAPCNFFIVPLRAGSLLLVRIGLNTLRHIPELRLVFVKIVFYLIKNTTTRQTLAMHIVLCTGMYISCSALRNIPEIWELQWQPLWNLLIVLIKTHDKFQYHEQNKAKEWRPDACRVNLDVRLD